MKSRRHNLPGDVLAIRTEVKAGRTFARIALTSRFADRKLRNAGNARKAYDTARRWLAESVLSAEEANEVAEELELLKAELDTLDAGL